MLSNWLLRIKNANKYYDEWSAKFKCNKLEQYYEGFHWKQKQDVLIPNYQPYTLNLVYATIKIKLSNFLIQRPQYIISPKPGNADWEQEVAIKSAQLKQDVLNTIVQNQNVDFAQSLKLTALDSFFRFGMLEVGYAADWRNPAKVRPLTKAESAGSESVTSPDKIIEDIEIPENERFYFKRIKAKQFRVSSSDDEDLTKCDWCGYYEYFYKSFLRRTYGITLPQDYKSKDLTSEYSGFVDSEGLTDISKRELLDAGSICKVWHIWDSISKKRLLLLDGLAEPVWEANFERLPLVEIRWDLRCDGWYPIPPVWHWISPQDEINEAREQMRSYRRRFVRKFQAIRGSIEPEEQEKFADGPDGSIITVNRENAITPIANPDIGPAVREALVLAKDDMNIITGTSAEARGVADRMTATQSRLIDVRSQIRESVEQIDFSSFVVLVGKETLAQAAERLTSGLWIKYTQDPGEQLLGNVDPNGPVYKWIAAQNFDDGYDFTVAIDVINASPVQMQEEKQKFIEFLALMAQFTQLALSPILIREAAYKVGYRNERVIQQMQQAAMLQMIGQASQGAENMGLMSNNGNGSGAGAVNPSNQAATQLAQQEPNSVDMVNQQLQEQIQ